MKEIEDENIISLLKSSQESERGFRLLLQKYQEKLYYHIRRIASDHEDANDILQNTLIKVFKNIHSFEGKSQFFTWLYRIATNESLTFLTQRKKRTTASLDDSQGASSTIQEAEHYVDMDNFAQKLESIIERLPEKQRLVFKMRYYDEMKYEEISEILDISVGGLKASYHHAVKKIESYITNSTIL
ncbi:MAG: sigma-70 family RNA polymerase sigma factor [Saprospiraceae bacterium]|nr:sigma-70 family RNA polymerase sigma factor [Saprospiraceae bacterium]